MGLILPEFEVQNIRISGGRISELHSPRPLTPTSVDTRKGSGGRWVIVNFSQNILVLIYQPELDIAFNFRQFIGGTMLFSSRQKQLPPVGCWSEEHLYQMTVWPCGRLPRIHYRSRRFGKSGPDLGLCMKKRRLQDAQKYHLAFRSGFRLCQR